jgi:tetratricopeptide (TPR) repeat protein
MMNRPKPNSDAGTGRGLVVAVCVLLLGCTDPAKQLLEQADDHFRTGDYLGSVRLYEQAVDEHPKSPLVDQALYWTATIHQLYLSDYRKALDSYQQIVSRFPKSPYIIPARRALAELHSEKFRDLRKAIAEYEQLLREEIPPPQRHEVRFRIGSAYLDLGNYDQARTEWETLLAEDPAGEWSGEALLKIGNTYFLEGRYDEAVERYRQLIQSAVRPDLSVEARFWSANCFEEMDRMEEALAEYRALQKDYPNPAVIALKLKSLQTRMQKNPVKRPAPVKDPVPAGPG